VYTGGVKMALAHCSGMVLLQCYFSSDA